MSNIVRRAAFALRFGSLDPLISGQVTSKTRVLMERDIRDRVQKLAPFLKYDGDPYPVALGNRTLWVLDAYTTTSMYPYSQSHQRRAGPRQRLQLRAQLGEGHDRRLRRHGHVLRVRPGRPGHPGVAEGLPRPVHRRLQHVEGAPGAPALPRRPVQGAAEPVRSLPRHRAPPLLRRQRQRGSCRPTPDPVR